MITKLEPLNLHSAFEPFFQPIPTKGIEFEKFNFPSGCEPHIKIKNIPTYALEQGVHITCRVNDSNDIMELLLVTDALKRSGVKKIELFIPYLPFARQDRVMIPGEPLSIKVMADLINAQEYSSVQVYDPHSDVAIALINNCIAIPNYTFVERVLSEKKNFLLISPDAGAYKKIFKVAQFIEYHDEIILCNKIRDVSSGKILRTIIPVDDFQGMDLYIIDDICDGGGTFLMLADELRKRNCGSINLVVSHGIFSSGTQILLSKIDHIYYTDSFSGKIEDENVTQIKLKEL